MEVKYLVTGSAGFIGNAVALSLLRDGHEVVGVDNINSYYDTELKRKRWARLDFGGYEHHCIDLTNAVLVSELFSEHDFDCVIHLAAQAGVRYSLTKPQAYVDANITGFLNILEGCRHYHVPRVFYASSSSVYGHNTKLPFQEIDRTDNPASLYAASKKCDEYFGYVYSHLFGIQCIGLRFFTVYGPWGRPDMALFKFVEAITQGKPVELYNHGKHARDFTYIDDIVSGIEVLLGAELKQSDVFNIASGRPVELEEFVDLIEKAVGKTATREVLPLQPGDVETTHADVRKLMKLGYKPQITLQEGVNNFVDWYCGYYGVTL